MAVRGITSGLSGSPTTKKQIMSPGQPKPTTTTTPPKATTAPKIVAPPTPVGVPGGSAGYANSIVQGAAAGTLPATSASGAVGGNTYQSNPSGSGWNGGTTDPLTGYLKQFGYTPTGAADLYNNPVPLASDVLGTLGVTNPGMAQQLSDLFDSALAGQFITNRGTDPTDNATLNFIAHAMQQAATPGGETLNYDYLLNTIMGATNPDANPLGNYLQYDAQGNALTPAQQAQTTNALASQALVALNPYAQRAFSGALGRYGNDYQAGAMKGDPGASSYVQYLKQSPFGNWF